MFRMKIGQHLIEWVRRPIILDSTEDHEPSGADLDLTGSLKAHMVSRKFDFPYKAKAGNKRREVEEENKA